MKRLDYSELPCYAHPISFFREDDRKRLDIALEDMKVKRFNLTFCDLDKLRQKVKVEVLAEEDQKLFDFRKKIFKINTSDEDLAYVFFFSLCQLKQLASISDEKNLKAYTECFNDLDRLKDILDIISERPYNANYYRAMLQRLTSPYSEEMIELIKFTQDVTKAFSIDGSGDDDYMARVIKEVEHIEADSPSR